MDSCLDCSRWMNRLSAVRRYEERFKKPYRLKILGARWSSENTIARMVFNNHTKSSQYFSAAKRLLGFSITLKTLSVRLRTAKQSITA